VICAIGNLKKPVDQWVMKAVPVVGMMGMELRNGKEKPVIVKTLVDLNGKEYLDFVNNRKSWEIEDCYQYPGPIQF
jgi:hypothetical protein